MVLRRRDAGVIYLTGGERGGGGGHPVMLGMEMLLCIHGAEPGTRVLQLFVTSPRLLSASGMGQ